MLVKDGVCRTRRDHFRWEFPRWIPIKGLWGIKHVTSLLWTLLLSIFNAICLSKALDFLAIAVHELASISERRIERLCNPSLSELPAFLVNEGGLNSGFMIAHCTAASLGVNIACEGVTNSRWTKYVCFAVYWLYLCFLLFRIREEKWPLISSVSENKVLCHPSSVDSLSTSAATEDHVSMGGWAARKALRVIEHVEQGEAFLQNTR